MTTVALYARVSTRDKNQNPEMQLEPMRQYCQSMGWELYQEFVDKVPAADLANRVQWEQLIKDASHHKFDILLIWKLDRAFRSIHHASNTLVTLNGYKVAFRSLMDPSIDTTTANGVLLFNILAAFAQFEKDLIAQRVKEGMKYAKIHGTKTGNAIGRPKTDLAFLAIAEALKTSAANDGGKASYTQAAKLLSEITKMDIRVNLVHVRVTREAIARNMTREQLLKEILESSL